MKYLLNIFAGLLFATLLGLAVFTVGGNVRAENTTGTHRMIVYKDPQCGCCSKWVAHMQKAGFDVTTKEMGDVTEVKNRFGILPQHRSCHTAVMAEEGFVFEGHIPASIIRQFLAAPPAQAKGLMVPGMPLGSPGMEVRGRSGRYDVLLLKVNGEVEVFSHVDGNSGA